MSKGSERWANRVHSARGPADFALQSITPGPLPLHDGVLAPDGTSTPTSNIGSELVEEEDKEILVHRLMTSKRNYHTVIFGHWKMKTWFVDYFSNLHDD